MKEYLLVAKGHRDIWDKTSDADWDMVMDGFGKWIGEMKKKELWGRSGRLTPTRADLDKSSGSIQIHDGPFTETKELTGFFIFKAENMAQAKEYAKGCPSLLHDSLSLYELEGNA